MNVFSIIYLLGAVQGILLVFVLAFRKTNIQSNRVLALLLGLFSINLFNLAVREYSPGGFSLTTAPFSLIYGPLLWLYVSFLTRRIENSIRPLTLFHFLPFISVMFLYSPFSPVKPGDLKLPILFFQITQYASYLSASLIILHRYESSIMNFFSDVEAKTLKWLRIMITVDFFSLIIVTALLFLHILNIYDIRHSYAVSRVTFILSSICIYVIGYFSMQQSDIVNISSIVEKNSDSTPLNESLKKNENEIQGKYEKSRIDKETLESYMKELESHMESEKPYKNADLTLKELADALSLSYHILSQVINSGFNQNFYTYINSYRIKEAEKILSDPKRNEDKILTVAYDSGFKNKSNFNTFFKKNTGLTPSEYRKKAFSK